MSPPRKAFRTPIGRVRGHGAAHSGTGHFIAQRATAIALLFLLPWFAVSVALSIDQFSDAVDFVSNDTNAVLLILLLIAGAWHMRIGMQVVIEDYIARPITRLVLTLLNAFVCAILPLVGVWAIVIVNFGYWWAA